MAEIFYPPSLLKYFEPPEGYFGSFGMICAYSADADFLDQMMMQFTGKTKAYRASEGNIQVILMLDKGNQQISLTHVPGLYHAGRDESKEQPFKLMHAKVAILHHRNKENSNKFILRLLVSTGNWTRETLRGSLDLISCIELNSEDFISTNEVFQQKADFAAAKEFFNWLGQFYKYDLVKKNKDPEIQDSYQKFLAALAKIHNPRDIEPRLFDNRKDSLLEQLSDKVILIAGPTKRNYLALGSGFYQTVTPKAKIPSVIAGIQERLLASELLTQNCSKDIFVNPEGCQAIAGSQSSLLSDNWTIRPAADSQNKLSSRTLHAKFIFSANEGSSTDNCSSPWLYLGSGNLTEAGFENKAHNKFGNLEMGIILSSPTLYWEWKKKLIPRQCVDQLLPVQWDKDFSIDNKLKAGEDFAEKTTDYISPPVSWFLWKQIEETGFLIPGEKPSIEYFVHDFSDNTCKKNPEGNWIWPAEQPAEIKISWGDNNQYVCSVPVIDQFGKVARKKLREDISLLELVWQLQGFPDAIPFTDEEDEIPEEGNINEKSESNKFRVGIEKYPIRAVMEIIEMIADKQTGVKKQNWKVWCLKLEQNLYQTRCNPIYDVFRQMNINPFSPLHEDSFRPDYSIDKNSEEYKYYEDMLMRIEKHLNLNHLKNI